jgi:hypothetical protein
MMSLAPGRDCQLLPSLTPVTVTTVWPASGPGYYYYNPYY